MPTLEIDILQTGYEDYALYRLLKNDVENNNAKGIEEFLENEKKIHGTLNKYCRYPEKHHNERCRIARHILQLAVMNNCKDIYDVFLQSQHLILMQPLRSILSVLTTNNDAAEYALRLQSLLQINNPIHQQCIGFPQDFVHDVLKQASSEQLNSFKQLLIQLSRKIEANNNDHDKRHLSEILMLIIKQKQHWLLWHLIHERFAGELILKSYEPLGIKDPLQLRKPNTGTYVRSFNPNEDPDMLNIRLAAIDGMSPTYKQKFKKMMEANEFLRESLLAKCQCNDIEHLFATANQHFSLEFDRANLEAGFSQFILHFRDTFKEKNSAAESTDIANKVKSFLSPYLRQKATPII